MVKGTTKSYLPAALILVLLLACLALPQQIAYAAGPFTVNTLADTHDSVIDGACADVGGACSLRAAIEEANAAPGSTTITLSAGTYNLSLGELTVAPFGNRTVTIVGVSAAGTIIHQSDTVNRVFNIDPFSLGNTTVTIDRATISGGTDKADAFGGAGILAGSFLSLSPDNLILSNCIVTDNHSFAPAPFYTGQPGGGLQMAGGNLTVTNCTFSNNSSASSQGGAIAYIAPTLGGTVSITGSTFNDNSMTNTSTSGSNGGGAVYINNTLLAPNTTTISNSSFTNNLAAGTSSGTTYGGAIYINTGLLNIDHSTFTANSVSGPGGQGGAIYVDSGTLTLSYSRLVGNTAPNGGSGVYNHSTNLAVTSAVNNWWGCNEGPTAAGCDRAAADGANLTFTPWIVLTDTASPNPIYVNQTSTLTASFLQNSAGATLTTADVSRLLGLPVTWNNAVLGSLSAQQTTIQPNGKATATFTAGTVSGTGHADATVDSAAVTTNITILPVADLAVTKTSPPSVVAGTNLTYTVSVTNNGPSAAGNVTLTDTLPAETAFVSQSQTGGASLFTLDHTGNTINNTIASLPAGETATFQFVTKVSANRPNASTLSNTASTANSAFDPDTSNNSSTALTTVTTFADVQVDKSGPPTVSAGGSLSYTIILVNNGPSDAQGIVLSDTLPIGTTFTSQNQTLGPSFTLTNVGNAVQNTLATLAAGETASFSISASVGSGVAGGSALTNTATVASTTNDSVPANNASSTIATVNHPPAITSADSATFTVGISGTFTVTTNGYPIPAVTQTGALPAGVIFVDHGDGTATLSGTPAVGSGAVYMLTFTAANGITPDAVQTFTLTVNPLPEITSANAATFTVGAPGTFTVTTIGVPIPTLSATGALPDGVTFVDNGNGTASLAGTPSLGSVGDYPLTITAHNSSGVDGVQSFTLTVQKADSAVTVVSSLNPSVYGQSVTFTATVTSGSGTPTGLVQFSLDGSPSGAPVSLSGGITALAFIDLTAGTHLVGAAYTGDANFNPSSTIQPLSQVVNQADTTTTVSVVLGPSLFKLPVTLTALVAPVAPGAGHPTGTVTFMDGAVLLGTVNLDAGGTAILDISDVARGRHNFTATYNGDANFKVSADTNPFLIPFVNFLILVSK